MTDIQRETRLSVHMGREESIRVAHAVEAAEAHRWRCREVLRSDKARKRLAEIKREEARQ